MARYIDISDLHIPEGIFQGVNVPKLLAWLESLPAADVEEVRHGEWEDDADDLFWGNYIVKKHCSECGYTPEFDRETELFNLTKRCPNCGAKMDGKENEDD